MALKKVHPDPDEDNLKYLGIICIVMIIVVIAGIIIFSIFVKK